MGLRRVKYLYIKDETGELIADCEGGPVALGIVLNGSGKVPPPMAPQHNSLSGIGSSDHHEKTGSYEIYGLTENRKNLPTAKKKHAGKIIRHRTGAGQPTAVNICVKNSSNDWEWLILATSN